MTQDPFYEPDPPSYQAEPIEEKSAKNKTLIIIIIVAAVLLLCCCCAVAAWFLWQNGDQILEQLGLYPLTFIRKFYPTAGRSNGIMLWVREDIKNLFSPIVATNSEVGPTLSMTDNVSEKSYKNEKV